MWCTPTDKYWQLMKQQQWWTERVVRARRDGTRRSQWREQRADGDTRPLCTLFLPFSFDGREKKLGKKIYYAAFKKHQLCCPHRKGCKQLRRAARHDREFRHCGSPLRSYGSTRQTISVCAQGAQRTQGVVLLFWNMNVIFYFSLDWAAKNCIVFLLFEQVQFWFSQPKITDLQVTSVDRRFRLLFHLLGSSSSSSSLL